MIRAVDIPGSDMVLEPREVDTTECEGKRPTYSFEEVGELDAVANAGVFVVDYAEDLAEIDDTGFDDGRGGVGKRRGVVGGEHDACWRSVEKSRIEDSMAKLKVGFSFCFELARN